MRGRSGAHVRRPNPPSAQEPRASEHSRFARQLGITVVGARKHLNALLGRDLVQFQDRRGRIGRPQRLWLLTEEAQRRFPDSHSFLTVEIISAARAVFGEAGLDRLIQEREADTIARYRRGLQGKTSLGRRVAGLARLRDEEGYMANWQRLPNGSFLLVENHCPICAAARLCQGFCRSELSVFREVLGRGVAVERAEHIVSGARRCSYVIRPAPATAETMR